MLPRQRPVTFDPAAAVNRDDVVLAHLNHPLVAMSTGLLRAAVSQSDTGLHRVTAVSVGRPCAGRRARGRVLPVRARRRGRCAAARGGAARRRLDARARPLPALGELGRAARRHVPRAGGRRSGAAAHPRPAGGALAGRPRRRAGRDRLADERPGAVAGAGARRARAGGAGADRRPARPLRAHPAPQARRGGHRPRAGTDQPGRGRRRAATSSRSTAATGGRGPSASTSCRTTGNASWPPSPRRYADPQPHRFPVAVVFVVPRREAVR